MDLNVWIGEGFVGTEPKISYIGDKGTPKCFFTIANHRGFGDNPRTNWVPCVLWGDRVEKLAPHIAKGKAVSIVGELNIRNWQNNEGGWEKSFEINVRELIFRSNGAEKPEETPEEESPFATSEESAPEPSTEEPEGSGELQDGLKDW